MRKNPFHKPPPDGGQQRTGAAVIRATSEVTTPIEGEEDTSKDDNKMDPEIAEFLESELALFEQLSGVSNITELVIVMRDERPIKQRYFPKNPAMLKIINAQINDLLRDGKIEPSKSPHSAPVVLVGKKTGEMRMCVDFRQLNARYIPDA